MRITHSLPLEGSVAHTVCAYLQLRHGRALMVADVLRLQRVDAALVPAALAHAVECGLLVASGRGRERTYMAGPNLADTVLPGLPPLGQRAPARDVPVRAAPPAADGQAQGRPKKVGKMHGRASQAVVDLATVPVRYDLPAEADHSRRRMHRTGYDVLFHRLDKVGAWAELPMVMLDAARTAARVFRNANAASGVRFATRRVNGQVFTVRRVA